ncbi:MAG TPA: membrane protein insertion efficiency factor YidD [Acidobacteriaceae bacterium]|nr:membrane protein insertion efficiency factor YidD [Acidobacteriaceae bacterium]
MSTRERTIAVLHRAYKYAVSPALHAIVGVTGACRFQPTCSEYAAIAVSEYGLVRGGWMALWRVLRCQPLCKGGFDPVRPNPRKHTEDSPAFRQRPVP